MISWLTRTLCLAVSISVDFISLNNFCHTIKEQFNIIRTKNARTVEKTSQYDVHCAEEYSRTKGKGLSDLCFDI